MNAASVTNAVNREGDQFETDPMVGRAEHAIVPCSFRNLRQRELPGSFAVYPFSRNLTGEVHTTCIWHFR